MKNAMKVTLRRALTALLLLCALLPSAGLAEVFEFPPTPDNAVFPVRNGNTHIIRGVVSNNPLEGVEAGGTLRIDGAGSKLSCDKIDNYGTVEVIRGTIDARNILSRGNFVIGSAGIINMTRPNFGLRIVGGHLTLDGGTVNGSLEIEWDATATINNATIGEFRPSTSAPLTITGSSISTLNLWRARAPLTFRDCTIGNVNGVGKCDITATLVLNADGGDFSGAPTYNDTQTANGTLPTFDLVAYPISTRQNHTFMGWAAKSGGAAVASPYTPGTTTLYALWGPPVPAGAISSLTIPGQLSSKISGTNITVTMPFGTDVTNLAPAITHTGLSVTPDSGIGQNFTFPMAYTVTMPDGSFVQYIVTVVFGKPPPVAADYDSELEPEPRKNYEKAIVVGCKERANVRSGSSEDAEIVGRVNLNELIELLQWNKNETWCQIMFDGGNRIGWLHHKFIKPIAK